MSTSDRDVTPEGDGILDMYGSPTCSTPPPRNLLSRPTLQPVESSTNIEQPKFGRPVRPTSRTTSLAEESQKSNESLSVANPDVSQSNTSTRSRQQLRDIQNRLNSLALASADTSVVSLGSLPSPGSLKSAADVSTHRASPNASIASNFSSISSLTRQSSAEIQLVNVISHARATLRHDILIALMERVVADTISLYTTVGDDHTARAAVDRVSMSLTDFILRYVAQASGDTL